ncbi:MAG: hypothetical protein V7L04_00520 [Nostoc sp.]
MSLVISHLSFVPCLESTNILFTNPQCPMPHAPCPMPHAPCPMPNAPIPMPQAQSPKSHAQCPMPNALITKKRDEPAAAG